MVFTGLKTLVSFLKPLVPSTGFCGYIFEKLYPHPLDTDSKFWICIQFKVIRIRFLKLVSNPRSYGYDFWNLYPIWNSLDTTFETCIQSGTLWIRILKIFVSKSKIIRDTITNWNPNPNVSSYKIKWNTIQ